MESFDRLGRDLSAALLELQTRIRNGDSVSAEFIEQIITLAYVKGANIAQQLQGALLGGATNYTPAQLAAIRASARQRYERIQDLFDTWTTEQGEVSRAQVNKYLELATDTTIRNAYAQRAFELATERQARFKVWVRTSPVTKPRDHHDALNGVKVRIDETFTVAGVAVAYPHDWDALPSAREWLHCGHGVLYTRS